MYPIERVEALNVEVTRMVVRAPEIARKIKPGQFVMLRIDEEGERIPLTMNDCDPEAGTVTIVFQAVGATTMRLARLKAGDALHGLRRASRQPHGARRREARVRHRRRLGHGHRISRKPSGCTTMAARWTSSPASATKDLVILEDEIDAHSTRQIIMTDDGVERQQGPGDAGAGSSASTRAPTTTSCLPWAP